MARKEQGPLSENGPGQKVGGVSRADLFAALDADLAKAEAERDALRVVQNLHSRRKLEARADKAEALLAEAVEALRRAEQDFYSASNCFRDEDYEGPMEKFTVPVVCYVKPYHDKYMASLNESAEAIRATLARIKEAKNG